MSEIRNEYERVTKTKEDIIKEINELMNNETVKKYLELKKEHDSLSEEQVDSIITSAYNKVNSLLPVNTYFTSTESSKMYDLSINVYTQVEASEIGSSNSRQYKLLHKNSTESQYEIEDLAHPKNPELAAELEGLTPSGEESESEETTSN